MVLFALLMGAIAQITDTTGITSSTAPTIATDSSLPWVQLMAILLLLALGVLCAFAGVISFNRAKTTVHPLKPETASALVTSGIYRFSRNPMYLGMAFTLCAWACYLGNIWSLVGVIGFLLYMYRFQIRPEERALERLFGQAFIDYKKRVRPWL
ncbi:isoprenylcysteine carboxylmethyltransferase family protein [Shewanella sp. Isolate13]|uniref:methyltransferase family protein n=1 Tax=Shewanella sp. Isolate13 TaxID=2908531 RepID=UPI001EFCCA97|nr:isoprenylcysteine carboxylmethyltransferase family protein [Shewanella sp. Isolate13]MCG9730872.1 isoprenylcysteine carboxylmethyltransferase family protein [Shewanella sp. Isolate13]